MTAADQPQPVPAAGVGRPRCAATVAPMSANVSRRPIAPPPRPGPKPRIGTCSRVWSVPRQVGSLPWSAVMIARSPGLQRRARSRAGGGRRPRAPPHSRAHRGGGRTSLSKSTKLAKTRSPSPARPIAASARVEQRHVAGGLDARRRCRDGRRCRRSCRCVTTARPASVSAVEQRRLGRRRSAKSRRLRRALEAGLASRRRRPGDDAADAVAGRTSRRAISQSS